MGRFSKISQEAFAEFQVDAGMILNQFDPESANINDGHIVCATTGGITPSCIPSYEDWGEDVDNCPNNMKELKRITGWDCSLGFTALNVTPEVIKMSLGAADIAGGTFNGITPRRELKDTDFEHIWWVGDRSDGGCVAIQLKNALSTGGFSLQTSKNGKGQISVTLTGHVSIDDQDVVPMQFYVMEGSDVDVGEG